MVDKLIKAGPTQSVEEQIIATRKKAFNKVSKEFKNLQPIKQAKQSQKRVSKTSKNTGLNKSKYAA
jgi:hypothetical protein